MPKNSDWKQRLRVPVAVPSLGDPKVQVRAILGILLTANLIAAGFAFHLFDASPQAVNQQLTSVILQRQQDQARLVRSRVLVANVAKGRGQGDNFLASYMTTRRSTFSTIIGELNETSKTAGMKIGDYTIAPLDPVEGSEDLDMMTLSVNFEGGYQELVRFINLLDRSPRFLIIESINVTPRPKGEVLVVNVKLNAFVKDDRDGAL